MADIVPLVFYDVPRVPAEGTDPENKAFSANTWKTRYVLNIKRIPYKTVWLEYPDIAAEMQRLGVGHGDKYGDVPVYTVPTIYDPNTKRAITDSERIALYLDAQYPQGPTLFPPQTHALQIAFMDAFKPLLGVMFPMLAKDLYEIMTPYAKPYIRMTREQFLRCTLEDAAPTGERRQQALKAIEAILDGALRAIRANGEKALFLGGDKPVYADLYIAALLMPNAAIVGSDSDLVRTVEAASGGHWARFLEYFKDYETVQ